MENKRKINLIEWAMKYRHITLALATVFVAVGLFALMNMSRNEFPEFTVRQGLVVAIYPGASSNKVEEQVTKQVENYLFGYKEVNKKETHSISKEGQMIIFVTLNDDVKNADQVWSKLRLGLNELKSQLPMGVLALIGNNDFGDTAALLYTVSSPQRSQKELEHYLDGLKSEIRKVESVSKIKTTGVQKEKIFVHIQPEKLSKYSIKPLTVMAAFQLNGGENYSGNIDDGELVYPIHVQPRFESEEDLKNQIIYSDPTGNVVRLKDVAYIERKPDESNSFVLNNGSSAIVLSLEMTPGNNIVHFGEEIDETVAKFQKTIPADIQINKISDLPTAVKNSVSNFLREFGIAILAVILITMLLLPFRVASVAAITIPISVFMTMAAMYFLKIPLDTVTLASLIVVLGMVVDNAIVIVDNHVELLDKGGMPWESAIRSAKELFSPVLVATLAIMAMFWPMYGFLKGGMAGDFVKTFPMTISLALIASLIVAAFLVPLLSYTFIKKGLHKHGTAKKKTSLLDIVQALYNKLLEWMFKHSWLAVVGLFAAVGISVLLFPMIDQQMFPKIDRNQFAIEFYLPTGSSVNQTESVMDSIENMLLRDERVTNVASFVGASSPRFFTLYAPKTPSSNYGQMLVNTASEEVTLDIIHDYNDKYSEFGPDVYIKWKQLEFAVASSPIEVRICGDDINGLKNARDKVVNIFKKNPDIVWINDDWEEKILGINVAPDENIINQLGISKGFLATSLMLSTSGLPLTTVWEEDYPVDVVLTQEDEAKNSITALNNQEVTSLLSMQTTPLRAIADLKPEWQEGQIARNNGRRTITVAVEQRAGTLASTIFKEAKTEIDALDLQEGITIEYGGDHEEEIDIYTRLGLSLATGTMLVFFLLLFKFKSPQRSLLIMATMPMSLLGVCAGLLIVGYPFGMTAAIGVLGLMGMVVRNGIILVDYVDILIFEQGMSVREAALAGGKRRMRPIFLTAAAAAMGVVPMILSGSSLWGPLGTVICFGLLISMVLTLLFLPVLYAILFEKKDKKLIDNKIEVV